MLPRFSFGDEGLVAQNAYRIYQGQVPFRDFFTALVPGSYYWWAFLFKLFGPSFFTLRLGVIFVSITLLVASWFALARSGVKSLLVYMVPAAFLAFYGGPIWFIASYHWLSGVLCMAAFALLLPSDDDEAPSMSASAMAGALSSLAVFVLQHRGGLWVICASLVFLLLPRTRRLRPFVAYWFGIAACAVPAAVYFLLQAGWKTLYYDLFIFPLTRYNNLEEHRGTISKHLIEFWQTLVSAWQHSSQPLGLLRLIAWGLGFLGNILVHLLPFLGLYLLWRLWKTKAYSRYHMGCLTAFFISSYLATLHRLSSSTLIFAASSSVILVALSLDVLKVRTGSLRPLGVTWILIFFSIAMAYSALTLESPKISVSTPAGAVQTLYAGDAVTMQGVASFASATWKEGETAFCYPYAAIFYFLFRLNNPSPYDLLVWPMNSEQQFEQTRSLLLQSSCRWIIVNTDKPRFRDSIPLEHYISEQYIVSKTFKYATILERRP